MGKYVKKPLRFKTTTATTTTATTNIAAVTPAATPPTIAALLGASIRSEIYKRNEYQIT